MELLDQYVQAVRFWLPKGQQDDIVAELSEDIRSQVADEEATRGRGLTDQEIEAILKQRGSPLLVASRYLPQESLIGPALFPVYRLVLKIMIFLNAVPWLVDSVGRLLVDPSLGTWSRLAFALHGVGVLVQSTLVSVGAVTAVFAVMERLQATKGLLAGWSPRRLPGARDPNQIPRFASVVELAVNLVFVVWWLNVWLSEMSVRLGGLRIVFDPRWRTLYWVFLFVGLANIALSAANLFRAHWTPLRALLRLGLDTAGAFGMCWILKAPVLAWPSAPNVSPREAEGAARAINALLSRAFPVAVVSCALVLVLANGPRLLRLLRGPVPDRG
jgi:hypothetical protein